MGSAGDCYDNAMAESWFATLKREGLPIGCYLSSEETRLRVIDFIEGRYNTCRSHSALGYQSPRDMRRACYELHYSTMNVPQLQGLGGMLPRPSFPTRRWLSAFRGPPQFQ